MDHPIKHVWNNHAAAVRSWAESMATCWSNPDSGLVEICWVEKLRGPRFEPILFKVEIFTTNDVTDNKGRPLPTVHAMHASENEEAGRIERSRNGQPIDAAALGSPDASIAKLSMSASIIFSATCRATQAPGLSGTVRSDFGVAFYRSTVSWNAAGR